MMSVEAIRSKSPGPRSTLFNPQIAIVKNNVAGLVTRKDVCRLGSNGVSRSGTRYAIEVLTVSIEH
jgi:hypothetical protein